ncbi:uncharacterized protein LOC120631977 isoform X1 [Pararge aegeria]|uniref:alpha-glucosidase n=2 Tax=Pararge aegeria TaxID=116150 RepID=A0A8S4SMH3_9NEOP|nr:uncharacterized protein LOC120631977 isoform X1 [Pararge aegeria]CAH2266057.1 jg9113 [Pararge aegeria aegeria]
MSETRKNHLTIDGGQVKEDEHVASYKPIPEADTDFRTSKISLHKSKDKLSFDGAEEKLLDKEEEARIVTRVDMVDAKYAVGDHRNGDAKIELDANKRQFSGLSKEELLKYAEDPFWVRLRWVMFALFWAMWLCMLGGAIIIIVRAPKCSPPTPRTWYEKGPLVDFSYVEDYQEVENDLPLMEKAKVSGIFASACKDTYEVLNESPPACLKQFKEFALKAKSFGVQVIVDLTANFVSKTHTWFQQSENKTSNFSDYFIWASSNEFNPDEPGQRKLPNNWVSTKNAPAWTWSEKRQEFYLHQFEEDQPDLNFNNPQVVMQFDAVIKKWMEAGAAGIRLHHARELLVNSSFPEDIPRSGKGSVPDAGHFQYEHWLHRGTRDQAALDGLLARWTALVATHATGTEGTVFTIAEERRPELFVLDRNTTSLRPPSAAEVVLQNLTYSAAAIDKRVDKRWPAIQLTVENGTDEELAAFAMLLPATPLLQPQQIKSKGNQTKVSELLTEVVSLREDSSVQHGRHAIKAVRVRNSTETVIACARWKAGQSGYVAVYNPGTEEVHAELSGLTSLPAELSVFRVSSFNAYYTINSPVDTNDVIVPPKASVLLSYVPKTEAEQ